MLVLGYMVITYPETKTRLQETLYAVDAHDAERVYKIPTRDFSTDFPKTGWTRVESVPTDAEYIGRYEIERPL